MKFSVLLPTRNRLEYLKFAILSVLNQDYDNWEIIVSDNFSEQDICFYIKSLNEPRIKYFRTDSFVSVTENWNNTLDRCSGDYVIMLGDDDSLMKGYFITFLKLIEEYPDPDFIYTSSFLYAYPEVMPGKPKGFLIDHGNASFLENKKHPFWIGKEEALKLVRHSMNFQMKFANNMQYALINRKFIEKLKGFGKFFQSPYPDFYAMNAMMLNADKILACPYSFVTIGICPKSFGFYYFNQCEKSGIEFLNHCSEMLEDQSLNKWMLPGTNMNSAWLVAMDKLRKNYEIAFDLYVNYKRYRFVQIVSVYSAFAVNKNLDHSEISNLWKKMNWTEKLLYGNIFYLASLFFRLIPQKLSKKVVYVLTLLTGANPRFNSKKLNGEYKTIKEVFENINPSYHK